MFGLSLVNIKSFLSLSLYNGRVETLAENAVVVVPITIRAMVVIKPTEVYIHNSVSARRGSPYGRNDSECVREQNYNNNKWNLFALYVHMYIHELCVPSYIPTSSLYGTPTNGLVFRKKNKASAAGKSR